MEKFNPEARRTDLHMSNMRRILRSQDRSRGSRDSRHNIDPTLHNTLQDEAAAWNYNLQKFGSITVSGRNQLRNGKSHKINGHHFK